MKYYLSLFLLCVPIAAAGPLEPRTVQLDARQIADIEIGLGSTTMLEFPGPIEMVVGGGLTDGSTPGEVQYAARDGSNRLVLRGLDGAAAKIMQVVVGGDTYVFRLNPSKSPDTLVRLAAPDPRPGPDRLLARRPLDYSKKALAGLLARSRAPAGRGEQDGDRFGHLSKRVSMKRESDGLLIEITAIHRFAQEDALVFSGTIRAAAGRQQGVYKSALRLFVGKSRSFLPNHIVFRQQTDGNEHWIEFGLVLVGDSNGERLHLSPDNNFYLEHTK